MARRCWKCKRELAELHHFSENKKEPILEDPYVCRQCAPYLFSLLDEAQRAELNKQQTGFRIRSDHGLLAATAAAIGIGVVPAALGVAAVIGAAAAYKHYKDKKASDDVAER